jgi:hypothetical protein
MARYRTYTVELKRRVAEEHLGAGTSLNEPGTTSRASVPPS